MKLKLQIVFVFLLLAGSLFAQVDFDSTTYIKTGDKLPAFTVKALNGKDLSSEELIGKVVLLNFWATWCPPCRQEMPLIQKDLYDKLKDKNFVIVAISRGEETDVVKKFIEQNSYTFPIYVDKEKKVYSLFAKQFIPRNFVIGKDGKVKWATMGYFEKDFNDMIKLIEKELED